MTVTPAHPTFAIRLPVATTFPRRESAVTEMPARKTIPARADPASGQRSTAMTRTHAPQRCATRIPDASTMCRTPNADSAPRHSLWSAAVPYSPLFPQEWEKRTSTRVWGMRCSTAQETVYSFVAPADGNAAAILVNNPGEQVVAVPECRIGVSGQYVCQWG